MSKLRKSAKGRECLVKLDGHCNGDNTTVVLAHVGKSHMGGKCPDIHATFACSSCHNIIDNREPTDIPIDVVKRWAYEGMMRTQLIWLKEGLISES